MPRVLELIGFGLCHQLPERSFFAGGVQLPVCARDTGIYAGFVVAVVVIMLFADSRRAIDMPPRWLMVLLVGFIATMAVDGVSSYAGWRETNNDIRLATGLAAGFAIGALSVPMLNGQLWRDYRQARILGRPHEAGVFLIALPVTYLILRYVAPATGALYAWLVALFILLTFTTVNLVIVCLLRPFERRAARFRDAWPSVMWAFVLTVVELTLASFAQLWLARLVAVVA